MKAARSRLWNTQSVTSVSCWLDMFTKPARLKHGKYIPLDGQSCKIQQPCVFRLPPGMTYPWSTTLRSKNYAITVDLLNQGSEIVCPCLIVIIDMLKHLKLKRFCIKWNPEFFCNKTEVLVMPSSHTQVSRS